MAGNFIISLDFELHWGVSDVWHLEDRLDYFNETRKSIPVVLELFVTYEIHATWATVGYLFAKDKKQLRSFFPQELPNYINRKLSSYTLFDLNKIGTNETDDPYHFAPSLIELILKTPHQELGTHTFSHYYCNEEGQTVEQFDLDLKAAQAIAKQNFGITLQSLVFPRNQLNSNYLVAAKQNGIRVVRSNPDVWFWKMKNKSIGVIRAFDTLLPISKTLTFGNEFYNSNNCVVLLPASRFLRPYSQNEKHLQLIKVRRIKREMLYAAVNKRNYHLWWHPHNFGYSTAENMVMLTVILEYYKLLNTKYDFLSKSMIEMDI
jgi:peptidoglycan/xylan/chitin deacetylase (PgdA/CDA1 family)